MSEPVEILEILLILDIPLQTAEGKRTPDDSVSDICSLRSPDRKQGKSGCSCPTEVRLSHVRERQNGGNVKNSQRNAYGALPEGPIYRHRLTSFHIREANCPRSLPSLRV